MARKKKKGELPSGNIRVRALVGRRKDGTLRYESFTAPTKDEAELKAKAFKLRIKPLLAAGIPVDDIPRDESPVQRTDTVQECLNLYLETCRTTGLSPSTVLGYSRMINRCYKGLKSLPVPIITAQLIQQYVNQRVSAGASSKTIRSELSLLGCALRQARPDLDMRLVRVPRQMRQEIQIPTTEQIQQMITAAKDTELYIPLLLAALMGLRRSEICALKWDDVDLKQATLHIHSAVVRGDLGTYQTKPPKTLAGDRVLSIPSAVVRAMAAARTLDSRVTRLTPDAITRRFERLLEKLKLSFRFHDLRHYHASVMISVGAPNKYIIADMGHSSMDMVQRVYGHVMADKQKEIDAGMEIQADAFNL